MTGKIETLLALRCDSRIKLAECENEIASVTEYLGFADEATERRAVDKRRYLRETRFETQKKLFEIEREIEMEKMRDA